MKNIDKILFAIKIECNKLTQTAELNCLGKIAKRSKIPQHELLLYLNELQERGYIKFSVDHNTIYLTEDGKRYIK